jgi:hypothetical protein
MRDDDVAYASRDLAKDPRVVSSADLGDISGVKPWRSISPTTAGKNPLVRPGRDKWF